MFAGLSTLRAKEKSKEPLSEQAKKLQQYLAQQYGAGAPVDSESGQKKKKKKKKPVAFSTTGGVKILDEDVSGFSASKLAAQTLRARADEIDDDDNQDDGTSFGVFLPCVAKERSTQLPMSCRWSSHCKSRGGSAFAANSRKGKAIFQHRAGWQWLGKGSISRSCTGKAPAA